MEPDVGHKVAFESTTDLERLSLSFCNTVPLKSKLPLSRETRLVSLETRLVSRETRLVSRECTGSTNASCSGDTNCRYSNRFLCQDLLCVSYRRLICTVREISAGNTRFLFWSTMRVPVYHKISSKIFNTVLFTSAKLLQLLCQTSELNI